MIKPFDLSIVIPILYLAVAFITGLYYSMQEGRVTGFTFFCGMIWPIILWFEFLTNILQAHGDKKKHKQIQNKTHFFDRHQGEIHPELKERVKQYQEQERKAKRARNRTTKATVKRNGRRK